MPYSIEPVNGEFQVFDDKGKPVGDAHKTRKQATDHLRALYANVPEATKEATDKAGDYLVAEDVKKPSTWHLQVRVDGKPDHRLMGAAWAALHGGYRGNKYEGADKSKAIEALKKLYESEKMPVPSEKEAQEGLLDRVANALRGLKEGRRNASLDQERLQQIHDLAVANGADCMFSIKEANGMYRWVLLSSNSFQDSDKEIVSQAALEADVARTDKEATHDYGPLRWWHMGNPDPLSRSPGDGVDIGTCDFRAMHGRVLIESGTFKDTRIGAAIAKHADTLAASIGFFHPLSEPDSAGVFNNIHTFERSILPSVRASNKLTALTVTKSEGDQDMATVKEKWSEFVAMLGGDEDMAKSVVKQAEKAQATADSAGLAFKEETPASAEDNSAAQGVTEKKAKPKAKKDDKKKKKGKGKISGSSAQMRAMFARLDESGERTSAKAANEPDGDEEGFDFEYEYDPDEIVAEIMPAVEAKMRDLLNESRKETSVKEASQAAQIEALTAQLKQAKDQIAELAGDAPAGVRRGFRASIAPETVTTKEAPNSPQPDPLGDMFNWMITNLNHQPGA